MPPAERQQQHADTAYGGSATSLLPTAALLLGGVSLHQVVQALVNAAALAASSLARVADEADRLAGRRHERLTAGLLHRKAAPGTRGGRMLPPTGVRSALVPRPLTA